MSIPTFFSADKTLTNCLLKNTGGYYSRIQDEDNKVNVSIYHTRELSNQELGVIAKSAIADLDKERLVPRKVIQNRLVSVCSKRYVGSEQSVTHYSKYRHASGQVSFTLALGEEPEYFCCARARAEFPEAPSIVDNEWKRGFRKALDWNINTLVDNSHYKFTMVACKSDLAPDELFMIVKGFQNSTESNRDSVTVSELNQEIAKIAKVGWKDEKVNLPKAISIHNGKVLSEIIVTYSRNYFLAEE